MIRIQRASTVPPVLTNATRRAEHERDYLAAPDDYDSGTLRFAFDRDLYGHPTVKAVLVAMQHEKCAFCESKPLAVSSGDVEHFRPKAQARSSDGGALEYPGYYWLAYDWDNLLFACERCNRRQKASQFPLAAPRTTRRTHLAGIVGEEPLFLDPASEEPTSHIGFRRHVPYALTPRGAATIGGLGLARSELARSREERLNRLFDTFRIAEVFPDISTSAKTKAARDLANAISDQGEYAAMNRSAVAVWRKRIADGQALDDL